MSDSTPGIMVILFFLILCIPVLYFLIKFIMSHFWKLAIFGGVGFIGYKLIMGPKDFLSQAWSMYVLGWSSGWMIAIPYALVHMFLLYLLVGEDNRSTSEIREDRMAKDIRFLAKSAKWNNLSNGRSVTGHSGKIPSPGSGNKWT